MPYTVSMIRKIWLKEAIANSKDVRIRVFKNDFLEKFSYVNPLVPFAIYLPVIAISIFFFFTSHSPVSVQAFILFYFTGLLIWTFVEYAVHRFVLHPPQINQFLCKFYFYTHGIHHEAVEDATRSVLPPSLTIPIAVASYYGLKAIWPEEYLIVFAGFVNGYLLYEFMHVAVHFSISDNPWFKFIRKNHMRHHALPKKNFGVSSPLWDIVFNTYYHPKPGRLTEKKH